MEEINVINTTMELDDYRSEWFYDEKHECWCLEDLVYTPNVRNLKFQRMSIYVPGLFMKENGIIVKDACVNGYTPETAPVILVNNSAGYMQMPHMWLDGPRCTGAEYLKNGMVFVTCGNRGSETRDKNGVLCGKSPANLVDLKTVIRFLRHNAACIAGNMNRIISVGTSAGGAMSSLLGVTGDNERYLPYLEKNGAFMEESDAVYAAQCYCPIIDLEHADLAYEWMFHEDKENEDSPAGPAGVMTPFQDALSLELKRKYIAYFNSLGLKDPKSKEVLQIGEDLRDGSGAEYLKNCLEHSASVFLRKMKEGKLPVNYQVEDYLSGNYEHMVPAPQKDDADLMQGHAGPGVAMAKNHVGEKPLEPPTLGDMVARPPKGVPFIAMEPPMVSVKGEDKSSWLKWDGKEAHITDLYDYVMKYRRRMKPCTSFDTLGMDSGENRVFGDEEHHFMHFNPIIAEAINRLKDVFPEEYEMYYDAFAKAAGDTALAERIYLFNPLNYIGTEEKSKQAEYFRIRVGSHDADTCLTMSMALALKLAETGKSVDYAQVWDLPHCDADYPGEFVEWVEKICQK